jgi:hypothetical protein
LEEYQPGDAGGPTRQFFDQVWLQLADLEVQLPHTSNGIKLFAMTGGGLVPETDEYVRDNRLSNMEASEQETMVHKIESYYRAVGRMMAHSMLLSSEDSGTLMIASHALPMLYLNGTCL